MCYDLKQVLAYYNQDPKQYITSLPDTSESANILIDLISVTNKDSTLLDLIKHHSHLEVHSIVSSEYELTERLNLLELLHLQDYLNNLMLFYAQDYNVLL